MNAVVSTPEVTVAGSTLRTLSWGAIIAGCVAALALQILLMMLGAGLGFAMYHPLTNDNPVGDLGTGAAVIQGVTAVVSLWIGAWVAGRCTGRDGLQVGRLHGFMVWCLSTVVAILAFSFGVGWALGDLGKLVGGGLSAAGKMAAPAAGGASDLLQEATTRRGEALRSFVDEGLGNRPAENPAAAARAKRELGFAVTHFFTTDKPERKELVAALQAQGYGEADANKLVNDWTASFQRLKADLDAAKAAAEQKARELADKTADALAIYSLVSFFAFVIGALAAASGGRHGGEVAYRRSGIFPPASTVN
ncbi:MAG TPA: hypothetical protein VG734_05750 [Lacunisphaera sp.]|nr:hypothetical protein [Lacunisphaera sp.]